MEASVLFPSESIVKRKPDLRPYRDPSDSRLTVSAMFMRTVLSLLMIIVFIFSG